jgi:pantetheine-phosphate adenylyltransferase
MKIAIFPGTFDPFTIGHYDIVVRALDIFDTIIIAVGINHTKQPSFSVEKRVSSITQVFAHCPQVKVVAYNGLTIEVAKQHYATHILRGVRSVQDFEYERNIAGVNRMLTGIDTLLLISEAQYAAISSSMVRELAHFGKDISKYLP